MNIDSFLYLLGQIAPPFLLLYAFSTHGPGFWFLMGIPFLCLIIKLIKFQKNKYRLIRPVLTILISGSLCSIAGYSYSVAQDEAKEIYRKTDAQCKQESKCPKKSMVGNNSMMITYIEPL
ncbi:hypothetical protein KCM76_25125 [Zooshikella marina]|uniref:hypothetical protein n=1 Tax=Zooshikella ganghwensis TaxID=202772 RepID=UPI001BAE9AC9|nr:hypothetical protein [Zooshikella ganghwensis]MBU2709303.1 hypothetical protein [Zooshikella ganghwensis]